MDLTHAASYAYLSRLVPEVRLPISGVKKALRLRNYIEKSGLAQRHDLTIVEQSPMGGSPGAYRRVRIGSNPLYFVVVVRGPLTEDEAQRITYAYNQFRGRSGGGRDDLSMAHGETGEEHRHELEDWRQFTVEFLVPHRMESQQEYQRRVENQRAYYLSQMEKVQDPRAREFWREKAAHPEEHVSGRSSIPVPLKGITDALRRAFYEEFGSHKYGRVSNEPRPNKREGGVSKYTTGRTNEGTRVWFVLEIRVGPDEAIPADNSSGHVYNAIKAGMRAQGWDTPKLRVVQRRSWSER